MPATSSALTLQAPELRQTVPITLVSDREEKALQQLVYSGGSGRSLAAEASPPAPALFHAVPSNAVMRNDNDDPLIVHLGEILIRDKHEGWGSGNPEIYIKCRTNRGANYFLNLPDVDRTDTWYRIYKPIADMQFRSGENRATCKVRERDRGRDDYLATVTVRRRDLSSRPKLYDKDDAAFTLYLR